jgi:hypothetical protein
VYRFLAVILLGLLAASPSFAGTVTYDFAGQCSDCTGTAAAQLVLQNYTPGTPITLSSFSSFT